MTLSNTDMTSLVDLVQEQGIADMISNDLTDMYREDHKRAFKKTVDDLSNTYYRIHHYPDGSAISSTRQKHPYTPYNTTFVTRKNDKENEFSSFTITPRRRTEMKIYEGETVCGKYVSKRRHLTPKGDYFKNMI